MNYQTYRRMTKSSQKQKTVTRHNFAEHIIIMSIDHKQLNPLVQIRKIIYFHKDQISHNLHHFQYFFMIIHKFHKIRVKTTHFFNKIETHKKHLIIYHQTMMTTINQTILHHKHRNTVYNNLDQI